MIYTTITLCLLALLHLALSFGAIGIRRKERIGLNHGKNSQLASMMRAQSNTIEYSVWFIPLLALAEIKDFQPTLLGCIAVLFIIARCWYAISFVGNAGGASRGRVVGTVTSITAVIALVFINIWLLLAI